MYVRITDISKTCELGQSVVSGGYNIEVGLVSTSFIFSCYNVLVDKMVSSGGEEKILKAGFYMFTVQNGKVSISDDVVMPKYLRQMILKLDTFEGLRSLSFRLEELNICDNIVYGVRCRDLNTWHASGEKIRYGSVVNVEPKNILYKRLLWTCIHSLNVSIVDGNENKTFMDYPIEVVLHFRKKSV